MGGAFWIHLELGRVEHRGESSTFSSMFCLAMAYFGLFFVSVFVIVILIKIITKS